ncbi:hypothetical protein CCDG5_1486 [[Clostridium] cellulosi]|uniref:Abasic site processing protein n=1 Tax=[Clostridium] cellulosi TaxID=29343 RepID=A0A078KLI9_9FIRM|nr:hypothetical protein CCDG5_1486 [[Clostridium] cellulosi]
MCAVYKLKLKPDGEIIRKIKERYGEEIAMDYLDAQLFPKSTAPVLGPSRKIALLKWGFPVSGKSRIVFNARAESLTQKPMFKSCIQNRCIVPATGFFEWGEAGGKKQKYEIETDDEVMYFAALFKKFYDSNGEKVFCYTIITTPPNDEMAKIHSRMPAILDAEGQQKWLDPQTDPADILLPYPKSLVISRAE